MERHIRLLCALSIACFFSLACEKKITVVNEMMPFEGHLVREGRNTIGNVSATLEEVRDGKTGFVVSG